MSIQENDDTFESKSSEKDDRDTSIIEMLRRTPVTFLLIAVNAFMFGLTYLQTNSFAEPEWTLNLLKQGAVFTPYTLDGEWYRIFTHMFLHGNILHIIVNMFALYFAGREIENEIGSINFSWLYVLTGAGAALTSAYWTLFTIGVGASGAIFGLFGFQLINNLVASRREGFSVIPVILNFAFFVGINLFLSNAFHGDHAAHFGGLACGLVIGICSVIQNGWFWRSKVQYAFSLLLIAVYFALPRYQVEYYKFFQNILAAEDSARAIFDQKSSDDQYLKAYQKNIALWDTTNFQLNNFTYLPEALHSDTAKLRQYIRLRKQELEFRIHMIQRESYIYVDSIEIAQDSIQHYTRVDYPLSFSNARRESPAPPTNENAVQQTKVYYNKDWEEVKEPPFAYYRLGTKDSLGRWQGKVIDYYANGIIQMKGTYKDNERDGIFIYYSDHRTYTSAGRYRKDLATGKWEEYHNNGRLAKEEYYGARYFMKNLWDSAGAQFVKDGNGKVILHHANGIIAEEGEYRDGYKEGYWYGRHPNGQMYYEENFYQGRLTKGRSRTLDGKTFIYDESSLYPLPEGGESKLRDYVTRESSKYKGEKKGKVRLSFRVTENGNLTDFKIIRSVSPEADELSKEILKSGPRWIPGKDHGHKSIDGFSFAEIDFQ